MIGLRISAPVVVVLLLVELALGLLGRVAPSLNVMTAGAPVRIVAGLLVLGGQPRRRLPPHRLALHADACSNWRLDWPRAFR